MADIADHLGTPYVMAVGSDGPVSQGVSAGLKRIGMSVDSPPGPSISGPFRAAAQGGEGPVMPPPGPSM